MGAPTKRARKVRAAAEFDVARLVAELTPPRATSAVHAWSLEEIFDARNQQMLGQFRGPARLAESMRTDDALFVAYANRLAPSRCVKVALRAAKGARATSIASEADALFGQEGIGIKPDTVRDIHGCLVNHGVAFALNTHTVRPDGSRVDVAVRCWPIEWVRWDGYRRCYVTQTEAGAEEEIRHGDGRWTIFQNDAIDPFKHGVLLAAALVWGRHAFANRDWAKGSVAHGAAKIVGEMPETVPLQAEDGSISPQGAQFLALLRALATSDLPIGIRPAGAKTEFVTNTSSAWQVWKELVANAEGAAARIYLGTDGTLGSKGGAPGVDINALFGVATTYVEGDLRAIERGFREGVLEPWAAMNFGDSALAPSRVYLLPDADANAEREAYAKRQAAFFDHVERLRRLGFVVDQAKVDALAERYDVDAPALVVAPPPTTPAAAETPPVAAPAPPATLRLVAPVAETVEPANTFAERNAAFLADLADYRRNGLILDQARVDELARKHDVPTATLREA